MLARLTMSLLDFYVEVSTNHDKNALVSLAIFYCLLNSICSIHLGC